MDLEESLTEQLSDLRMEEKVLEKVSSIKFPDDSTNPSSTTNKSDEYSQFPVTITTNATLGRYLIARRNIKCGEILLRDDPVFMSPNAGTDTCLGCCLKSKQEDLTPCSKCGWPVCGTECEKELSHAKNECKIFAKSGIQPPLPPPYCFIDSAEYIKVLRVLTLASSTRPDDMARWEVMQQLESHQDQRSTFPKVRFMSTLAKNFIRGPCNLKDIPEKRIEFILGIIDVNAFRHTIHPNNPLRAEAIKEDRIVDRNATFLYSKGSMVAHGCRRNARWETLPNGTLEMWAAEDISAGDLITHPYVDLMKGTPDRRRELREQFYFDCSCSRCSDPTELGTNFSTLKCPECVSGDLLPNDPLDYESSWSCGSCSAIRSFEYERELLEQITTDKIAALELIQFDNNIAVVGALAMVLGKYRGKKLHPNHASVVDIEYHLVKRMALMKKPTVDLLHEMRKLIHKFLDLAVVFYPGIK